MAQSSNKYVYLDAEEEKASEGHTSGNSNNEELSWRLETGIVSEKELDTLKSYFGEIVKFNPKLNLVSKKTIHNSDLLHFHDSIVASKFIGNVQSPKLIFDLGSGNGFPGVVFAILNTSYQVVLVDHDGSKVEFLKHLKSVLGLDNLVPKCLEINSLPDGCIEFALCRGLAPIAKTLLLLRKQMSKNGFLYHLKGPNWISEVNDIPSQLLLNWATELKHEYELPEGLGSRYVVESQLIQ